MTQNDLQVLANIYNNLLGVSTHGEDTFIMADSMRALKEFIFTKQKELEHKEE